MKRTPRSSPRSAKPQRTVSIIGTGSYVPEKILTNDDLSQIVETDDEWITTRTGIKERRIAADDEYTSDMGAKAALAAMKQAGITGDEIDLILVATATPDMVFPATACFIQTKIGANQSGLPRHLGGLRGIPFRDRNRAAIHHLPHLRHRARNRRGKTDHDHRLDGAQHLCPFRRRRRRRHLAPSRQRLTTASSARISRATENLPISFGCPAAVRAIRSRATMSTITCRRSKCRARKFTNRPSSRWSTPQKSALEKAGLTIDDIACVIPHQANVRIIEAIADRLKIPVEKFFVNFDRYGNTSAAAVAIALDEANRSGRIKAGDYVLMVVFGGGLTWAGSVIEW